MSPPEELANELTSANNSRFASSLLPTNSDLYSIRRPSGTAASIKPRRSDSASKSKGLSEIGEAISCLRVRRRSEKTKRLRTVGLEESSARVRVALGIECVRTSINANAPGGAGSHRARGRIVAAQ